MKASELCPNSLYVIKLEKATVCRLISTKTVKLTRTVTHYEVLNLKTNRICTVKSASKFLRPYVEKVAVSSVSSSPAPSAVSKVATKTSTLADSLKELEEASSAYDAPHIVIVARAGTGKTTTMEEGVKYLRGVPTRIQPSEQQQKIWDVLVEKKELCKTIGFCAFNRSIADELKARVGKLNCDAMTIHSLGRSTIYSVYPGLRQPDAKRVEKILEEITTTSIQDLRTKKPELVTGVKALVSIAKMNLVGYSTEANGLWEIGDKRWEEALWNLLDYYDIDCDRYSTEVIQLVPKILHRAMNVVKDGFIDFDDMVWLPVVLKLAPYKYDLLIVDEAQDLNPCQQELVQKAGTRLVLVGDDFQAIYGFTGADSDSIPNMYKKLSEKGKCVKLFLTVTRRCGKAIVNRAKEYVPDFQAHSSNPEGRVIKDKVIYTQEKAGKEENNYLDVVQEKDMVLCRTNAPLVSQCFKLLREERKAVIRGRDLATGLLNLIDKLRARDIAELVAKLETYFQKERDKENAKKFPSETKLLALDDKEACLDQFIKNASTVEDVKFKIDKVFNDKATEAVVFSSVHKAKGLEADNVFLLLPKESPMPHPMAKSSWAKQQEFNLLYVAITRAKNTFYEVSQGM